MQGNPAPERDRWTFYEAIKMGQGNKDYEHPGKLKGEPKHGSPEQIAQCHPGAKSGEHSCSQEKKEYFPLVARATPGRNGRQSYFSHLFIAGLRGREGFGHTVLVRAGP